MSELNGAFLFYENDFLSSKLKLDLRMNPCGFLKVKWLIYLKHQRQTSTFI
ncbi:MAG: hypothetical protein RL293_428 [Bacteroidota bacterium]